MTIPPNISLFSATRYDHRPKKKKLRDTFDLIRYRMYNDRYSRGNEVPDCREDDPERIERLALQLAELRKEDAKFKHERGLIQ